MSFMKKLGLFSALFVTTQAFARTVDLDSVVQSTRDEAVIRTAIREYMLKHPNLVLYFSTESAKTFIDAKKEMSTLFAQYPKVMFVLIDLTKYRCLKHARLKSFLRVHKNGIFETETELLPIAQLKALLDYYYR